jgi:hypothetical protein
MTDFHVELPDELVGGTYAQCARTTRNGAAVVLDFLVRDDRAPAMAFRVVSRVRLDITSVQQLLSNLAGIMNEYDEERRLALGPDADGPPQEPPADPQSEPGGAA